MQYKVMGEKTGYSSPALQRWYNAGGADDLASALEYAREMQRLRPDIRYQVWDVQARPIECIEIGA